MTIQLRSLVFPTRSTRGSAIDIRHNYDTPASSWHAGVTRPEQAPVAFVFGDQVSLRITLSDTSRKLKTVALRGIQPPAPPLPPQWRAELINLARYQPDLARNYLIYLNSQWKRQWYRNNPNPLGTVPAVTLNFNATSRATKTVVLPHAYQQNPGVRMNNIQWLWQYRLSETDLWRYLTQSVHRVYTLLSEPKAPWIGTRDETQQPWTEVLDVACAWARGARSEADISQMITQAVYSLGRQGLFQYGCPVNARTVYAYPAFNCSEFLERLNGGFGLGPYVNCSDCATFVSSFANILGCSLWQSQMFTPGTAFPVRAILTIGDQRFAGPCGGTAFTYHEVAWSGQGDETDAVGDACLVLNASPDGYPIPTPLLPTNRSFVEPGQRRYRDMLATRAGQTLCQPQPETRTHRYIY
jgi:hypothetical protein